MPLLLSAVYAVTGRNFTAWRVVNCGIMAGRRDNGGGDRRPVCRHPGCDPDGSHSFAEPGADALLRHVHDRAAGDVDAHSLPPGRGSGTPAQGGRSRTGHRRGRCAGRPSRCAHLIRSHHPCPVDSAGQGSVVRFEVCLEAKSDLSCSGDPRDQPWWIRNIVVHDAFMPLGTQGGVNLPMGFGPRAFRTQGIWASNPGDGWPEIAALNLDIVTSEVMLAQYRQTLALNWMKENPALVVHLMRLHVGQELKPGRRLLFANWLLPGAGTVGARLLEVSRSVGDGADGMREHSQRRDDLQRGRAVHGSASAAARGPYRAGALVYVPRQAVALLRRT